MDTCHFSGFISKLESVGENLDVGGAFQLVAPVRGNVEPNVVALQQGHLGFGVLVSKRKLFRNHKVHFDAAR